MSNGTNKHKKINIEIPQNNDKSYLYRFFEVLPGALSWTIMLSMIPFAYFKPEAYSYFIVFYILSWVIRAFLMTMKIYLGYKLLKAIDNVGRDSGQNRSRIDRKINNVYLNLLSRNRSTIAAKDIINEDQIYHIVVIPVYNESYNVLKSTVQYLARSKYNHKDKTIIIVTYEARTGPLVEGSMKKIERNFSASFLALILNKHELLPGEVPGKGANISSCKDLILEYCDDNNINHKHVLVTTLDADNRVSPNYFIAMDRVYCSTKSPEKTSLQPVAMYTNNIWSVPALSRLQAVNNTMWSLSQAVKPRVMRNFSSHTQSLESLVSTNFWSKRTIVEDGHQYWRSLTVFAGEYRVLPVYTTMGQDAVETDLYFDIFKAQFAQLRRWSYGVSDIPYVLTRTIPSVAQNNPARLPRTMALLLRLFDTHINWATNSFMILLAPMLPAMMNVSIRYDSLSNRLPFIISNIQSLALLSLALIIVFNFIILPRNPEGVSAGFSKRLFILLQWSISPIVGIIYGSGASLYSQTRLMLGMYYEKFEVTNKRSN
jgi:hypothetical protein